MKKHILFFFIFFFVLIVVLFGLPFVSLAQGTDPTQQGGITCYVNGKIPSIENLYISNPFDKETERKNVLNRVVYRDQSIDVNNSTCIWDNKANSCPLKINRAPGNYILKKIVYNGMVVWVLINADKNQSITIPCI